MKLPSRQPGKPPEMPPCDKFTYCGGGNEVVILILVVVFFIMLIA